MSKKCSIAKKMFTRCFTEAKQTGAADLAKTKIVSRAALAQTNQGRPGPKQTPKHARIACSATAKQIGTIYFVKAKQNHHGGFANAIQTVDKTRFAKAKLAGCAFRYASHGCVDDERIALCQTTKDRDSSALARPLGIPQVYEPQVHEPDTGSALALTEVSSDNFGSNIHSMP
jgi:hypothetical protein